MSAELLLSELERLGVRLEINGDRLKVEAPAHVWTPELRAKVAEAKADLLAALRRPPAYSILADGSQVAHAGRLAEALEILPALVRSTSSRPGHTVRIEIRDPQGKPVRLVFLPPWQGVRS